MSFLTQIFGRSRNDHYAQGIVHFNRGEFEQAIGELEQAVREAGGDGNPYRSLGRFYTAEAYTQLGMIHLHTGDLERARAEFERAVSENPGYPDRHYYLGVLHQRQGNTDAALVSFQQALALNPNYREARAAMAVALFQHGEAEAARTELAEAVARGFALPAGVTVPVSGALPAEIADAVRTALETVSRSTGFVERAVERYCAGDVAAAAEALEQAVAAQPGYADLQCRLGVVYGELGRHEESLAALDRALGINARYTDAHLYRGLTLLALGRPADAIDDLCQAAAVYATTPGVLGLLATAYARSGQVEKAQQAARDALTCDPSCGEAKDALAVVSLQSGNTADAARLLTDGDLLERAALLLDCGEARETIHLLAGSPGAQVGSSVERDVLLGRAYELTGEVERARMHYESATIKDESWWPARLALARTWSREGAWVEALRAIGRDLEADSESPEVLVLAGDCHRHLGRPSQAIACYGQALNIFAGYVPALVGRALAHRLRGDEPAAQSDLHAALRHDPMNVLARRLMEIGSMSSAEDLRRSLLGSTHATGISRAA